MLAIRLQRTGRKGHAQYRVVVQDSHRSPTSGKVIALLGSYNPHTKMVQIDTEKAKFYLDNGAQPSDRVVSILKQQKVSLPKWVSVTAPGKRTTKNPDKLRKNQPEQPETPAEQNDKPTDAPASDDVKPDTKPEAVAVESSEPAADKSQESESETTPQEESKDSEEGESTTESTESESAQEPAQNKKQDQTQADEVKEK